MKISPLLLAATNAFSVAFVLIVNYYSQTAGINGQTVGELSDRYDNLFTPAGYAFAIWGIIFLSLIIFVIYQVITAIRKDIIKEHEQIGLWFAIVNIGSASWVIAWLYEYTWLSVVIMCVMLFGLLRIIVLTNMERWDAPFKIIAFIWWPICLYSGWITVALIANISAYLSKLGWSGGIFSEENWAITMIAIATLVNLFMIWKRNMREFALVGVWALAAIYFRHEGNYFSIALMAMVGAILLALNVAIHGFINRKSNPIWKSLSGNEQ